MAEEKKKKRPTAEKRVLQDQKKREFRKTFKSKTRTAIRSFLTASKKDDEKSTLGEKLRMVYSLVDKGIKKRILKKNTGSRIKSRLSAHIKK